jgi:hypothetical protein
MDYSCCRDVHYYRELLSANLRSIDVPYAALLCTDVMCCTSDHCQAINRFADGITRAYIDASNVTTLSTAGHCKCNPG